MNAPRFSNHLSNWDAMPELKTVLKKNIGTPVVTRNTDLVQSFYITSIVQDLFEFGSSYMNVSVVWRTPKNICI